MKLKYETPEMEVIEFTEDEIATEGIETSQHNVRNLIDDSDSKQAFV